MKRSEYLRTWHTNALWLPVQFGYLFELEIDVLRNHGKREDLILRQLEVMNTFESHGSKVRVQSNFQQGYIMSF